MSEQTPPRDNLLRASYPAMEFRAEDDEGPMLVGHFSRFNEWARIDSYEGTFMERVAPGAFARTLKNNRANIRVLLNHGKDPELGDKPIAAIRELHEDGEGAYYEAKLLDGIPPLVMSGLRENQYGASFRFSVLKEDWDQKPKRSTHNPEGLPERTIQEARVMEFGPVTWGAYAGATAGIRSISLSDLDAASAPPEQTEALPDAGPAAMPHSDEGTREAVVVTIDPAPPPKEKPTVDYVTVDEKRARDREITDELTRTAAEYTGVLPTDEQARWDGLVAEQDQLRADIAAYETRLARLEIGPQLPVAGPPAAFNVIKRKSESDIFDYDRPFREPTAERRDQMFRDNALRAAEQASYPATTETPAAQTQIQRMLDSGDSPDKHLARRIVATGSPLYRRAFNKYVTGQMMSPEEQRGTALAVQVDGTGGFALPFSFDPTIIPIGSHSGWQNPYRQFCRVETIVGTDTWLGLTSTAVVATRADEAAASTEQGPTFAQPSALVTKVQGAITYSIEMGQDRPDIGSELAVLISEAKDNEEEAIFSTGVGDAVGSKVNPIGFFAAHGTAGAYTHVNLAAAHTLAIGDLDALEAAVPVRHRANAVWLMNERILRTVQGLETTGGRLFNGGSYPAVGPVGFNPTGNTGLRLLNKPVYITPSATYDVTVDDTPLMWLGAGYSYLIVDRVGITVEYIPHVFADGAGSLPTGQRRLYFYYRNTGKPINTDGGRILMVLNA